MSAAGDDLLGGVRVVELASGIAAALAGRRLADLGAEVTKFEEGDGDWMRRAEPRVPGTSRGATFESLHRGKAFRRFDVDDRSTIDDLVQTVGDADVFICDRSVDWLDAYGFGGLRARTEAGQTDAAWILLSAYGPQGPWRDVPGSELTCQAASGYTTYIGQRGDPPSRLGTNVGETATGIFAVQAVLATMYARRTHGVRGQVVTLSTMQSLLSMASIQIAAQAAPDDYLGPRVGGAFYPPQRGWRCADGQITFAFGGAVGKDGRPGWKEFITELGGEWMFDDPRFDPAGVHTTGLGVRVEETRADYEQLFQNYSADYLVDRVRSLGGSAAKYQTLVEALTHPQVEALGITKSVDDPIGRVTRFPAWNPAAGTGADPKRETDGREGPTADN